MMVVVEVMVMLRRLLLLLMMMKVCIPCQAQVKTLVKSSKCYHHFLATTPTLRQVQQALKTACCSCRLPSCPHPFRSPTPCPTLLHHPTTASDHTPVQGHLDGPRAFCAAGQRVSCR